MSADLEADTLRDEYEVLKKEQIERMKTRDNLTYATLVAITAAVAGAIQAQAPALLLTIPAVCTVLGWTRLANDRKVSAIRDYIVASITPRLSELAGQPVLAWETSHREDPRRRISKLMQLYVDLLTFIAPPVAAVVYWGSTAAAMTIPIVIIIAATALTLPGMLAWQILRNADRPGRAR